MFSRGSPSSEATSSRVTLDHLRAPKVNQVDADDLDEGLAHMLGERIERSLSNFRSTMSMDFKPELEVILKLIMFRFSFFSNSRTASPGASLQNLKLVSNSSLRPSRRKLILYLLLNPPIFPSYILTKLRNRGLSSQWPDLPHNSYRRKLWNLINKLENIAKVWELIGWIMFLWDGKYPSILMRILGLRLVPSSTHVAKMVSYEFMNRQLVWGAFTEFLMFAIPRLPPIPRSLSPSVLLAPIASFFSQPTSINYDSISLLPSISSADKPDRAAYTGRFADLPLSICPICHLRSLSSPVPLTGTSTGSSLTLPPIHGSVLVADFGNGMNTEEMRVFVPAQTDCWGQCRWCYYCITGELIRFQNEREAKSGKQSRSRNDGMIGSAVVSNANGGVDDRWECLRCGGGVTKSWRVGAENLTARLEEGKLENEVVSSD